MTDYRFPGFEKLTSVQRARLERTYDRLAQLRIELSREKAKDERTQTSPSRTPEQNAAERDRRVSLVTPSWVKAAWLHEGGDWASVALWDPAQVSNPVVYAVAGLVPGLMPSTKNPERLNARQVLSGDQVLYGWPKETSALFATCEHASEEEWKQLSTRLGPCTRKDKARKPPPKKKAKVRAFPV